MAKKTRTSKNRENQQMFLGQQDYSHKTAGQSAEFLPKVPMAVEQISGMIKKALVNYGNWFSVDTQGVQGLPITDEQIREIIMTQLMSMNEVDQNHIDFPVLISDAMKVGLLQAKIIVKVYGRYFTKKKFHVERSTEYIPTQLPSGEVHHVAKVNRKLTRKKKDVWHIVIDLINPEDFYEDPTGRGLYRIHRVERDLHEVIALSEGEDPIYDPAVVEQIKNDFAKLEMESQKALAAGQDVSNPPQFRKRVTIDEFWGTILNDKGHVVHEMAVWARANDKYIIRKPEDTPFWHGQDPFCVTPLIRVPFSVMHKALMDHAVPLSTAINELFSLMLDGALASVHGIKQLRSEYVERPEDLSGGIAQGQTIGVKAEMPANMKVLENVVTGEIPPEAIQMMAQLDREYEEASMLNSLKLGQLPQRQVKATEIVSAEQSQGGMMESITNDLESWMEHVLWKVWMVILQEMSNIEGKYLQSALNPQKIQMFARIPAEERFLVFNRVGFKVRGLSATLQRAQDFQKMMALMTAIAQNPLMLQAFFKKYNPEKILDRAFKFINLNPEQFELSDQEKAQEQARLAQLQQFAQMTGQGGGQGNAEQQAAQGGGTAGGRSTAMVNQTSNPLTGMTGGEG